eukprot:CAMPEP_0119412650 /NCGR_PEP_ID=MMETSP1335-20130426/5013_1 /TAXON_ID=259385 /ORGANISM="Chrysoculter rhomboideus, Strain RCC1486" /LENGTH=200 /DNA_ID=CAMNT_0007437401 /DNA_START=92 /DNA_END=697 /DNA_ORIENTATION=+
MDWLEDDDATTSPMYEQRRREREYLHLESRMATLGFADGVAAGQESVMQGAFDAGYREGLDSVLVEDVEFRSMLATFVEFYARHGVALGMPVSIAALVFRGDERLGADEVVRRMCSLVCNSSVAQPADCSRWASLLGWGDGSAELASIHVVPAQLDVALSALLSDTVSVGGGGGPRATKQSGRREPHVHAAAEPPHHTHH